MAPFLKLFSAVMAGLLRSGFSRAIWRCRCSPVGGIAAVGADGSGTSATAPAIEAVTGTIVFPSVSSKGVAETLTSSMGVASAAEPAAAPSICGTVFLTASVGESARAPSSADETAALTAAPATSNTAPSAAPVRGAVGARESSTGATSSDAAAEAASSAGDTASPDALVERAARQLTLEESSAGTASSDAAAEAAPLTGDTAVPLMRR